MPHVLAAARSAEPTASSPRRLAVPAPRRRRSRRVSPAPGQAGEDCQLCADADAQISQPCYTDFSLTPRNWRAIEGEGAVRRSREWRSDLFSLLVPALSMLDSLPAAAVRPTASRSAHRSASQRHEPHCLALHAPDRHHPSAGAGCPGAVVVQLDRAWFCWSRASTSTARWGSTSPITACSPTAASNARSGGNRCW